MTKEQTALLLLQAKGKASASPCLNAALSIGTKQKTAPACFFRFAAKPTSTSNAAQITELHDFFTTECQENIASASHAKKLHKRLAGHFFTVASQKAGCSRCYNKACISYGVQT